MANTDSIKFVSAKTGSGVHQETEELTSAVSLMQEQQIFPIDSIVAKDNEVHITFVIENESLSAGYTLTECGIYAKEDGTAQEVLFAIGIPVDDILIPGTSDSGYYKVSEICEFVIVTSNADIISLEIPEQAHVLKKEFDEECKKNQTFINANTLNKEVGDLSQWLKYNIDYDLSSVIYSDALQAFVAVGNIINDGEKGSECIVKSKDLKNWVDIFETSTSRASISYQKCIEKGNVIFYIGSLQNIYGKYPYLGWYEDGVSGGVIVDLETDEGITAIAFLEDKVYTASKDGLFVLEPEGTQMQTVYLYENFPSADMYIDENLCICVGGNAVMVSTDLVNFEKKTLNQMTEITKVLKVSDTYIVLGEGNFIAKSEDGYNWEYVSCYTSEKIIDAVLYKNMILGISTNYLYPINLEGNLNDTYTERINVTNGEMRSITYGNGLVVCVGESNANCCKWWIANNVQEALYDTGWTSQGVDHNLSEITVPTDLYPLEYRRIGNRVELRGRLYSQSESAEITIPPSTAPSKAFYASKIIGSQGGMRLTVNPNGHIEFYKIKFGEVSNPMYLDFGGIGWYVD